MSGNQGRNYMKYNLKRNPWAYKDLDFVTRNKLMTMPSYWDNKDQLRAFHSAVMNNRQLLKALPP